MKHTLTLLTILTALLLAPLPALQAAGLKLTSPLEHQVIQRHSREKGAVRIAGRITDAAVKDAVIEMRIMVGGKTKDVAWQKLPAAFKAGTFEDSVQAPAGGWHRLEVRVMAGGEAVAQSAVEQFGVGEVFVVAGQSNSANHGAVKQVTATKRVAAFDGTQWQIADDPQPGTSGKGGSFMPSFGDAMVARFDVPVGFIACGIGATSVREWLPKGATFQNPPTIESRVEKLPSGEWASKGDAFTRYVARMKQIGPRGFRAVLWHQGESDANQKDTTRTLPGSLYRKYLERVIRESRREIGWDAAWFVAQVSYHVPGDEASPDIRAAQAALWQDGIALQGPDSDALKGDLRERDGQGVHFSGKGLREHSAKWAEKVAPWLERQLTLLHAADIELTETLQLPECHSIGWVRANTQVKSQQVWDGKLDETKRGTPSAAQVVGRNWAWKLDEAQWKQAVQQKGEGKKEDVKFDLWMPGNIPHAKGIVVISGHGSGEALFRRPDMRARARELHLALFKFIGNPMQRGFWPKSLLYERLKAFAQKLQHPELEHAPLFLYGHSNGTGFSAIFPATESARVWAWVSMRPGITFQVYQPGAAQVPGLVIFGEDDHFLARPSKEENLAVVPLVRKKHNALWNFAVEPKTGHGPGEKTWPLVFSFLRHTFAARVPADCDPRKGPVTLRSLQPERGYLGTNWDAAKGGYQTLPVAPFATFVGDKTVASWLINAAYATDWQAFQREGQLVKPSFPSPR